MGLTATAKGLNAETCYDCGYFSFGNYRMELAKAYNERFGYLYQQCVHGQATEEERVELEKFEIPEGLAIFLTHSDCDGKFMPKECKKIYDAIKGFKIDMQGHNYGVMKTYNMHEHWLNIFKHCYKIRIDMSTMQYKT